MNSFTQDAFLLCFHHLNCNCLEGQNDKTYTFCIAKPLNYFLAPLAILPTYQHQKTHFQAGLYHASSIGFKQHSVSLTFNGNAQQKKFTYSSQSLSIQSYS